MNVCNNLPQAILGAGAGCYRDSTHMEAIRNGLRHELDAGRHTEIDMFSGALIKMGKELDVPTPYNEYTYHMIKALEEKNDGLFNYTDKNKKATYSK